MKCIACAAPYGVAGLGQHLAQVVEEARGQGALARYYASSVKPGDSAGEVVDVAASGWLFQYTPARFSLTWRSYLHADWFDRAVAARLRPDEAFHGFSYQSFHCLRRARSLGLQSLVIESASVHVNELMRQQERAFRQFGLEQGWLGEVQRRRTLQEYALAGVIYVASDLSRNTFLEEGVPAGKLRLRTLRTDPRFVPPANRPEDGVFRIVYVGGLSVLKGVPVLLEAFARLSRRDAELTLVGGWGSRGMRRYVEQWLRRDPRIRLRPGDPLPYLQRATVCVHPSFTDGFAYAPMEALACGVPVIVSEDTGMKEHVREGVNGYVVPTGSWEALLERLEELAHSALPMKTSCEVHLSKA